MAWSSASSSAASAKSFPLPVGTPALRERKERENDLEQRLGEMGDLGGSETRESRAVVMHKE